jgi:hypothetical protein
MLDCSHHCEGEHGDITMPANAKIWFRVIEPELVLGGLEAVLD